MNIASELEKLKKLQSEGVLSDSEFAIAKKKLLDTVGAENTVGAGAHLLGKAANNYVNFQITTTKIGLVIAILFFFFFFLPQWNKISDEHDKMSQRNDASLAESQPESREVLRKIPSLVDLMLVVPFWGLTVRRLHDIGKSGWWSTSVDCSVKSR